MFKPKRDSDGLSVAMQVEESTVIENYDALTVNANGYLELATSATTEVKYISRETITTGAGERPEISVLYTDGVRFEADTNVDTAQAQVGDKVDLTDEKLLNNAAVVNGVFFIENTVGVAANKKVLGYFL